MSLHSTTDTVKKTIFGIVIFIGALICLNLIISIVRNLIPKKEIPPTVSFGQLPAITFSDASTPASTLTYSLQTISGSLPILPTKVAVYEITQPQPDLLALRNTKTLIPPLEFPNDPQAISDIVYQWTSPIAPFKILTYNILSRDFNLTSSYTTNANVIAANNVGDPLSEIATSKDFFSKFNVLLKDVDDTKTKTTLYSINANTRLLQPAISLSTTQIIQTDFFQNDVDKLPIYYPNPPHSLINTLVGSTSDKLDVLQANFIYKNITTTNGTYPIKTSQEAFMELRTGSPSAYVAASPIPPLDPISIRTISLGYYIGLNQQSYLMPIIVFQGDNGFYGYVSAVTDGWIKK